MATLQQPVMALDDAALSSGKLLGLKRMALPSLLRVIANGLPWSAVAKFLKSSGFTQQELARFLAVPERTLARRRESGALKVTESERLMRLAEIFYASMQLFDGDAAAAKDWLTTPARGLNHARPIDYAGTELGAREVRNLIGRIEYGVVA